MRILNLHWRTVLLYPHEEAHQQATKYIYEQLDRIFRRTLGDLYATSEVLRMEEGSVIAHHKVYLTEKTENITDVVRSAFESGLQSGFSSIQVDNTTSYYIPPPPAGKPPIWYLRYLALAIAIVIGLAILYDLFWRTNTCAVRSPFGYLEAPDGKQYLTLRDRLVLVANRTKNTSKIVASKTKDLAGRTFVASKSMAIKTKDLAVRTGRNVSNKDTWRTLGATVVASAAWTKTIGALHKNKSDDQQATLDPEEGLQQQADDLEKQLDGEQDPEDQSSDVQESGEDAAAAEDQGEAPAEEGDDTGGDDADQAAPEKAEDADEAAAPETAKDETPAGDDGNSQGE